MIKKSVWLIGTGNMAKEYCKVLQSLGTDFIVIGRGKDGCDNFFRETGVKAILGGVELFLELKPDIPFAAINASGVESLTSTTHQLLNYGVKYILLEKPGFGHPNELYSTQKIEDLHGAKILLAYNRRFYSSVFRAQKIIQDDGGVKSFNFEFTEWAHSIKNLKKERVELENWYYGNSSHIIDLAFYLGGKPVEISSYQKGSLAWHPSGEIFAGAGISDTGALFSYIANWSSPGRWGLELCTDNFRLVFRPIEELHIMKLGTVKIEPVTDFNNDLDTLFKPGLYKQVESFITKQYSRFSTLTDQIESIDRFYRIINKKI